MNPRNLLYVFVGLVLGLIGSTRLPLHAQKPPRDAVATDLPHEVDSRPAPQGPTASGEVSLQDALHRPYIFAFGKPTPLREVAKRLTADLGGQVVLDLAALDRLELRPEDAVELELKGVRLKTGLKLLLDQVDLTYRLVPEDNLLILTDDEGAEEPLEKVWFELNHLHRDLHDVQDMVEYLYDLSAAGAEIGPDGDDPRLQQPTIVEEMPGTPGAAAPDPGDAPKVEPKPDPKEDHNRAQPKRPRTRL